MLEPPTSILGGAGMDNTADVVLKGTAVNDRFGFAVSAAGDVNGDAYDDVIVGAPYNESGGNDAGRAYIYFGGLAMDNIFDAIITGAALGNNFGLAVAFAGDVNGDGYSDVMVRAPYNRCGKYCCWKSISLYKFFNRNRYTR